MAEVIIMPKVGFNMDVGELVKWYKKEGETVSKGEILFEFMTDKTNMEMECSFDGIVSKIFFEEGASIPVTLPIAIISQPGEDITACVSDAVAQLGQASEAIDDVAAASQAVQAEAPTLEIPTNMVIKLSPRARKYAAEKSLDISTLDISGTGFQDGITARDIEAYVKNNAVKITPLARKIAESEKIDIQQIKGSGLDGKVTKADVAGAKPGVPGTLPQTADGREVLKIISYTGMRKVIGDRLSQSKFTAPHLYFTTSVNMAKTVEFTETINKAQPVKVSFNDIVIAAVAKALQAVPELNAALQGDKIIQYKDVNVGMAVALENGLIVPVVKRAQYKKVTEIAGETRELAGKARNGKLLPEDYQGGTFTVSNLGMFGIENFTAIINPPEAGILSVSAVKKIPVVVSDGDTDRVVIKPVMHITVSVDHRIVDGLIATKFVNKVKDLLENPLSIVI